MIKREEDKFLFSEVHFHTTWAALSEGRLLFCKPRHDQHASLMKVYFAFIGCCRHHTRAPGASGFRSPAGSAASLLCHVNCGFHFFKKGLFCAYAQQADI